MSAGRVVGESPSKIGAFFLYLILIVGALISVFPVYWMFVISTQTREAAFRIPPEIIPSDQFLINFNNALKQIMFFESMLNSLVIAVLQTVTVLLFCGLAGFAFAKYEFPLRRFLFFFVLATLFVPQQLSLIPNYILMSKLGWINSFKAIVVPGMVNAFGIFWMRQYIMSAVSTELIEAGRIDGCSHFRIFWNIVVPIITPALATLGIFTFMNSWNDFMWPLVILKSQDKFTIQITLQQLFNIREGYDYGKIMSATFVATLPLIVVFFMFSRWFISGLTSGAVKS